MVEGDAEDDACGEALEHHILQEPGSLELSLNLKAGNKRFVNLNICNRKYHLWIREYKLLYNAHCTLYSVHYTVHNTIGTLSNGINIENNRDGKKIRYYQILWCNICSLYNYWIQLINFNISFITVIIFVFLFEIISW